MSDVNISITNIRKTKRVLIEGIGTFTVRKLGAGEELDLSDKLRRLGDILTELKAIDFTKYESATEEHVKELNAIRKRAEKLTKEVHQIQRFELDTYTKCFTDDNDGKDVKILLDTLSAEDRSALFQTIFKPVVPVANPEKTAVDMAEDTEKEPENA